MNSLRILFRWMLLGWLALVILMSVIVARSTDSAAPGNLLAFLFTRTGTSVPLPPLPVTPIPEPRPEPAPAPPPAEVPQSVSPEWVPLVQGRQAGKGVFGEPKVRVLDDGSLEVRLACAGTPGNFMVHHLNNVPSLSVDLQGSWNKGIILDRKLAESCLSRIQIAYHPKWLRVSGVARDDKRGLSAKVEHSAKAGAMRIIFSAGG